MKLVVTIEVGSDLLTLPHLLSALPGALDLVQSSIGAGIAETGPRGGQVQAPGTSQLATVHFRMDAAETVARRLPVAAAPAATEEGDDGP